MFPKLNQKLQNDIHLSISFALLFIAYNTQSHIQKTLTVSIQKENPEYTADGYVCFGIVYAFLSLTMWLSPAIIVIIGRKFVLVLGTLCYSSFFAFCYFENSTLTYVGSAVTGFGGGLLWTGQANYIVLNSEVGQVYQSISLFWMVYQSSYIFGNAFVYFLFHDETKVIDRSMRGTIAITLLIFVSLSAIMFCGLRPPIRSDENESKIQNPLNEIKKAYKITTCKTGLIYCILFIYVGINVTFMSILGASMGFSSYLSDNSKEYAPLSGFIQGFGEIIACVISLCFKQRELWGLKPIITIGCVGNLVAYIISFLGLPSNSVFTYTADYPLVPLSVYWLLVANFLIGFGDACIHIDIYKSLGSLYPNDSAPAFASFKFIRGVSSAISFFYGNLMGVTIQISILIFFVVSAYGCHYFILDNRLSSVADPELKIKNTELKNYSATRSYQSGS